MKFIFTDYINDEGEEVININFNFMKYSELIRILEPDDTPLCIYETFTKLQIEKFKEFLEIIEDSEFSLEFLEFMRNNRSINELLWPLYEYFNMDRNKDFLKIIDNKYYLVRFVHNHKTNRKSTIKGIFDSRDNAKGFIIHDLMNPIPYSKQYFPYKLKIIDKSQYKSLFEHDHKLGLPKCRVYNDKLIISCEERFSLSYYWHMGEYTYYIDVIDLFDSKISIKTIFNEFHNKSYLDMLPYYNDKIEFEYVFFEMPNN